MHLDPEIGLVDCGSVFFKDVTKHVIAYEQIALDEGISFQAANLMREEFRGRNANASSNVCLRRHVRAPSGSMPHVPQRQDSMQLQPRNRFASNLANLNHSWIFEFFGIENLRAGIFHEWFFHIGAKVYKPCARFRADPTLDSNIR